MSSRHPFFIRLRHWEYWNSKIVYFPLYPWWVWLSARSGSFFFPTAANPSIHNGGLIMESKKNVYSLLPEGSYPTTLFFKKGTSTPVVLNDISEAGIAFPAIVKPDIGERGLGVKKVNNADELVSYAAKIPTDFLVQELIPYKNEIGLFYCRMPGSDKGMITGIVNKEPVTVTGDDAKTIAELTMENERYVLQMKQIAHIHKDKLDTILKKGEQFVLVPYGNHVRGSKFTDVSHKITPALTAMINDLCSQVPDFYYGRFDIMFDSWEQLEKGQSISIIELNGSGSEPTHIYDPAHSLYFAWKEIIRHWKLLYRISKENNRLGVPYTSLKKGRKDYRTFREIDALLSAHVW